VDQEVFIAKKGVLHGGGKKRRPVMEVSFGMSPPKAAKVNAKCRQRVDAIVICR